MSRVTRDPGGTGPPVSVCVRTRVYLGKQEVVVDTGVGTVSRGRGWRLRGRTHPVEEGLLPLKDRSVPRVRTLGL